MRAARVDGGQPAVRARPPRAVYYPDSDGKPLGESDDHILAIFDAFFKLDMHVRDRADVYVASNNLLYYEEGNPRRFIVPDVYVVPGVRKGRRRIYKLWEEGVAPSFVLEVTSRSSRRIDLETKPELYARLGVSEYVLFDPLGDYLTPRLRGFRLVGTDYQPIAPAPDGGLHSDALGLELRPGDRVVAIVDPMRGRELVSPQGVYAARESAEAARESAEAARESAEAAHRAAQDEIARLRTELARRESDHRSR